METRFFECLGCGHFTGFNLNTRPRCAKCGGMTGIVDNDTETPRFRAALSRRSADLKESKKQH